MGKDNGKVLPPEYKNHQNLNPGSLFPAAITIDDQTLASFVPINMGCKQIFVIKSVQLKSLAHLGDPQKVLNLNYL